MSQDKKVIVPIGPQHPALKEPEVFNLMLSGERIINMDMRLGYNHRGIEKACEERNWTQTLYLIERICGICSMVHATCYIEAAENAGGLEVPLRAKYIRSIVGELERIHSHLLWLGVAGHEIGFDTLLMYSWRDRELVMDVFADYAGNRVNYGINCVGGVRRDLSADQVADILKKLDTLEERTKYYIGVATEDANLAKRLSGVGYISKEDALAYGALGPTLRASGVSMDVRRDDPCAAYGYVDINVITDDHCDVYGRAVVRLKELMESYRMLRQLLAQLPDGPISIKAPRKLPAGEAVVRFEAPRGEAIHYVKSEGGEKPARCKIRAPTLGNAQAIGKMMEGDQLADAPLVIAAIDPCFGCTDRMIRIQDVRGDERIVTWNELSSEGRRWYRENMGIDFTELNKKFVVK
jgi:NADH-quinone oxidoreductase subunit D